MLVLVMGVCGSGKTTVGQRLAARLAVPFFDADPFHPQENVEKMRRGVPLTDADRLPWLQRLNALLREQCASAGGCVLACSALKRAYRDLLRAGLPEPLHVLFLRGSPSAIAARMAARPGHFMPPSLLDSQLATLEPPTPQTDALMPGAVVLTVDVDSAGIDDIVASTLAQLPAKPPQ